MIAANIFPVFRIRGLNSRCPIPRVGELYNSNKIEGIDLREKSIHVYSVYQAEKLEDPDVVVVHLGVLEEAIEQLGGEAKDWIESLRGTGHRVIIMTGRGGATDEWRRFPQVGFWGYSH